MTWLVVIWPLSRPPHTIRILNQISLPAAIQQRALEGLYIATPTVSCLLVYGSISPERRRWHDATKVRW